MRKVNFLINYIKYWLRADNEHAIHSPFVFDFYLDVIRDDTPFYVYDDIESIRAKLLLSDKKIIISDHGAGSSVNSSNERSIRDIATYTLKSPKYGQLLFRMVNRLKPTQVLELGTSLGLSTMYLAGPSKGFSITTVEGCSNTAKVAKINFDKVGFRNIELVNDTFDNFLPLYLDRADLSLDFVFFDGNHKKDATLEYFNMCIKKSHKGSVFVFDDIYWSIGMREAWEIIKVHPQVTTTIDLYMLGIVFFNTDLSRENFVLRF